VRIDRPLRVREQLRRGARQVERVRPPVPRVAAPLDQPARLEVVDQRDHRGAMHPERAAERLLRLAGGGRNVRE